MKYALLLATVVGTAGALSIGVLGLGETVETSAGPESLASVEDATRQNVQVTVDVPVVVLEEQPAATSGVAPTQPAPVAAAPEPAAPSATTQAAPAPLPSAAALQNSAPAPTSDQPTTTAATKTSESTTTSAAPSTTVTTTAAPAATTEYLYFDFPGVASEIIVANHEDRGLEFWSVSPEDGWGFEVEKDTSRKVEIKFGRAVSGGEGEAKFEVSLEDGDVSVETER